MDFIKIITLKLIPILNLNLRYQLVDSKVHENANFQSNLRSAKKGVHVKMLVE